MKRESLNGNRCVRFDEGEVASAAAPMRGIRLSYMRKMIAFAALCIAAASVSVNAATLKVPYYSPMFRMGSSAADQNTVLTDTPQLAFPDMKLTDVIERMENGYVLGAYQCGTSMLRRKIQAKDVLRCRDPETDAIVKIVGVFVFVDISHTKSLSVELTDGDGGVYARGARAQSVSGSHADFAFAELDGNGGVIYSCDSDKSGKAISRFVAGWESSDYGACSLSLVKPVPKDAALFWANAPGEPTLTVEDIKDYDFTAFFCGAHVAANYTGLPMSTCNKKVMTDTAGVATSIRVEFQFKDGNYLKCAIVEFTNGDGGVYAQQTYSVYLTGGTIGYNFIKDDGTLNTITSKPSAPGFYGQCGTDGDSSGYGVMSLTATPPAQSKAYWSSDANNLAKTHNVVDVTKLPVVDATWTKILDGVSLQEMFDDGYELTAYLCGGNVDVKQRVYAKGLQSYTPPGETSISNAVCWFVAYDDIHTKSATIEMETRPDGVYAKYGKGQYLRGKNNVHFKFAWLGENGNVVYDCDQESHTATGNNNIPASWTAAGYGIAGIKASRFMKKDESRLVFANPAGEPVLTLDDIKDCYLGCSFASKNITNDDGEGVGLHRAFEYDGDSVRTMRVEYQIYDGASDEWYNKCVIINFTNGVDGIYGYATEARYAGKGTNKIGYQFVNADDSYAGSPHSVATDSLAVGYGIYDLFAVPMVTLGRDMDLSGIDGAVQLGDTVLDLNGHNITIQGVSGNKYLYSQMFNSNNSAVSEVRFNVPAGVSSVNDTVRFGTSNAFLNNNIKVVKKGNGTLVASVTQAYKGGTQITAGTLKAGLAGTGNPFGTTLTTITVPAGCTFDANGKTAFGNYSFVLDGGTIRSSAGSSSYAQGFLKNVSLTADSSFNVSGHYGIIGDNYSLSSVDLGGHTLSVDLGANFHLCNTTFGASGGVVDLSGGHVFLSGLDISNENSLKTNDASNVDFRVNCRLNILAPLNVHDYVALYGENSNDGTEAINVFGAFKPSATHNYFHGCRMMDGSTIDLTERAAAIPLVSAFTNMDSDRTLKFADGATVYVKLGGKRFAGGKVISWNETPENIAQVKFKSASGELAYAFVAKDDGLYAMVGMTIIVR